MAKRMFDSAKFRDPFYRKLSPEMKCAYEYLQSECDHAGVLNIDIGDVNFKIGCNIDYEDIKETFKDKIIILNEKTEDKKITELKVFLPKFIWWQYKNELTPNNSVHRSVFNVLEQESINTEQFMAQYVLRDDFINWQDLCKWMKEENTNYKEVLQKRV